MSRIPRQIAIVNSLPLELVDRSEYAEYFTEGFSAGDFTEEIGTQAAGSGGQILYYNQSYYPAGKSPVHGYAQLSLSNTANTVVNCRASLLTGEGGTNANTPTAGALEFGKGAMVFETRIKCTDVANATFQSGGGDYCRFGAGFLRWHAPATPAWVDNMIAFVRMDSNGTGNAVNHGDTWWAGIANNHGSPDIRSSFVNTGARLIDWNTFRIEISPTADRADFFVNGSLVRTALRKDLGLAFPAASDAIWPGDNVVWSTQPMTHATVQIRNNALTANHYMEVDYVHCLLETPKRRLG